MANRAIDPEVKARVLALLSEGNSKTSIARNCGVAIRTVDRWADEAGYGPTYKQQMREDVSQRVSKLLMAKLDTLLHIQETVLRDQEWLKNQNARDLAILVGVEVDKSVRILEALAPTYEDEEDTIA